MHEIEPFFNWRDSYISANDKRSPFYRTVYSEFQYTNKIYDHYIHPQWDFFGSSTLYCKVLFVDYDEHVAVIEFIGEWNDAIHNDVMELKRTVIDSMQKNGISKFVLIGENVLNFHASDELYYEEWDEETRDNDGWIVALNFRDHVVNEMRSARIHNFVLLGDNYNNILWRKLQPQHIVQFIENLLIRSLE